MKIEAIISDFGGVLTTPLLDAFVAIQEDTGVTIEEFGKAMRGIATEEGKHPLFELECGRVSELSFLKKLEAELNRSRSQSVSLHAFRNSYFDALQPNEEMIQTIRELRSDGFRTALLTNNVKEWEPHWRAKLPVDELFEVIVDSAFVGMRKPEREIYELTVERLGDVRPESCLFIDDIEVNCDTARDLGMSVIHFRSNEQAIDELSTHLDRPDRS